MKVLNLCSGSKLKTCREFFGLLCFLESHFVYAIIGTDPPQSFADPDYHVNCVFRVSSLCPFSMLMRPSPSCLFYQEGREPEAKGTSEPLVWGRKLEIWSLGKITTGQSVGHQPQAQTFNYSPLWWMATSAEWETRYRATGPIVRG